MSKRQACAWLVLMFAALMAAPVGAQTTGAVLQGTVSDEQGGVLPGANITVVNVETGWSRESVADARGWYRAAALPPGRYEIRVIAAGLRHARPSRSGADARSGGHGQSVAAPGDGRRNGDGHGRHAARRNDEQRARTHHHAHRSGLAAARAAATSRTSPRCRPASPASAAAASARRARRTAATASSSTARATTTRSCNTQRGGFSLEAVREFAVIANQFNAEYGMASGRHRQRHHPIGHQRPAGPRVRLPPRRYLRCAGPVLQGAGVRQVAVQPAAVRGLSGRPGRAGSLSLLRLVRAAARGEHQRDHLVTRARRPAGRADDGHGAPVLLQDRSAAGSMAATRSRSAYRADSRGQTGQGIGGLNTRERGSNSNGLDQDVVSSLTSVIRSNLLNELRFQGARRSTFTDTEGYSVDGMPQINRPSGNFGKAAEPAAGP